MRRPTSRAHLLASAAFAVLLALPAGGCKTTGDDTTGSIGSPTAPQSEADMRRSLDALSARYQSNPGDAEAAMAYAKALRANEQRAQAVAVLQQASIRNPSNMKLLGAYGRALADAGEYNEALDALSRAHTPDNPDWRILNAQGAVLDQLGRHDEAQRHYSAALKIVPNEPSVLSNLGLSYLLQKNLKRAEFTLRRAVAQGNANPKVRQNLALVVGLEGRYAEAEKIASADLPANEAAANVAYLKDMLARHSGKGTEPYVPPDPGS
ncbi:MAG TPA: tetratricopeptide repeat protein [Pseudolabrys sp.]|nr:tetratricopeptide repeat protein [Pseudolabrys sp.]